jgi:hypothetical protein
MVNELHEELRAERERLLRWALAPAGLRDLVELQAEVAERIRQSELARRGLSQRSDDRAAWKYHDQQLRVVGDTLAWLALDSHTIRNLGKGPGGPASLSGQWPDFQFVLQVARRIASAGAMVLISDVTNILRTGDLAVLFADGKLDIIECKNVDASTLSRRKDPRIIRQTNRGQRLASYLSTGEAKIVEPEIVSPEGYEAVQQAIEINHRPEYDWSLLIEAVEAASATGSGLSKRNSEFVHVQRNDVPSLTNFDPPRPEGEDSSRALFLAFGSDIIDNPSPLHPPVTYWPLSVEQRLAIWERDLYICHAVAEEDILGSLVNEPSAAIVAVERGGFLRVRVPSEEYVLRPRFLDNMLVGFETVASMREQALRFALAVSDVNTGPSPSPSINYGLITKTEVSFDPADWWS